MSVSDCWDTCLIVRNTLLRPTYWTLQLDHGGFDWRFNCNNAITCQNAHWMHSSSVSCVSVVLNRLWHHENRDGDNWQNRVTRQTMTHLDLFVLFFCLLWLAFLVTNGDEETTACFPSHALLSWSHTVAWTFYHFKNPTNLKLNLSVFASNVFSQVSAPRRSPAQGHCAQYVVQYTAPRYKTRK